MERRLIRIAVLHFSHETVTFLKNDTTLEDFTYPGSPARGEALLKYDPKNYMGGFVKMAREFDGVALVDSITPKAVPLSRANPPTCVSAGTVGEPMARRPASGRMSAMSVPLIVPSPFTS